MTRRDDKEIVRQINLKETNKNSLRKMFRWKEKNTKIINKNRRVRTYDKKHTVLTRRLRSTSNCLSTAPGK